MTPLSAASPICSVSIDVDSIDCYYRIHGLGEPPADLAGVIIDRCVPRFAELLDELEIDATFFVVASDVDPGDDGAPHARAARARIAALALAGHEIGNHSYSHLYDLARSSEVTVAAEIGRAHEVLAEIAGVAPRGFRAPGYDLSPAMQDQLIRLGYCYDTSLLPSPPYYLAKAAVMAGMRLFGRSSGAVMTDPRALWAPADPYRPAIGAPHRRGDAPLVELPVAVTPGLRIHAIGTSLMLAPGWLRRRWLRSMTRRPLFNFELHAIDLADAELDGIPNALVARQPDLRLGFARKRAVLWEILAFAASHWRFATLGEAADELAMSV